MAIDLKLIDQLLVDYKNPEDIIGENGLLKQLTKALLERAFSAELTEHVGYEKHDPAGNNSGNSRNGTSRKSLKGDFGAIELETPRDRNGSFEPRIVAKGQTRFTGFDDKIISMYSRGMTTREIEGHLISLACWASFGFPFPEAAAWHGGAAAACLLLAAPLWLRQPRRQYLLLWPRQSNRPSGVPCTGAARMGTLCLLLQHEPGHQAA